MKKFKPMILKDTTYTPGFSAIVEMYYNGCTYLEDECSVLFSTHELYTFRAKYNKIVLRRFLTLLDEINVTPELLVSLGFKKEDV